jgi:hypothetical protein
MIDPQGVAWRRSRVSQEAHRVEEFEREEDL